MIITRTEQCCESCWALRCPGREPFRRSPVDLQPCMFCGRRTASGIYIRLTQHEIDKFVRRHFPKPKVTPDNGKPAAPRELVRAAVAERPRQHYGMCQFCGRPCMGGTCSACRDLLASDPYHQMKGAVA